MELSMRQRREIDVEIATKIFGWSEIEIRNGNMVNAQRLGLNPRDRGYKSEVPKYTEDMNLAWCVVEKIEKTLTLRQYPYNRTYAKFGDWDNSEDMSEANGRYCTPTAICLAALVAVSQPNHGFHLTMTLATREAGSFGGLPVGEKMDNELLEKLAIEIQGEWGEGGLYEGIYRDFFLELLKRYQSSTKTDDRREKIDTSDPSFN